MRGPGYIHLHVHSAFSLLEGALQLETILKLAAADAQPAIGIADTGNLFGALEFSEKATKKGIQPLIGVELPFDFAAAEERVSERGHVAWTGKSSVVLMAQSEEGFANLSGLVSRAYLEGENGLARVKLDWLSREGLAGVICLSGGPEGAIDMALAQGQDANAIRRLDRLAELFDDRLYIELQRHGRPQEAVVEPRLIDYAYRRGIPLVAANEPFFKTAKEFEAHDALLAIAGGTVLAQTERRKLNDQYYFKTRAEMIELFADLPEALESTIEIAQRIAFRPRTRGPILPKFAAGSHDTEDAVVAAEALALREMAETGLNARLATTGIAPGKTEAEYRERLAFELSIIEKMKFPGYFLIVADFIQWSKAHGIPVGPGRGSGAGSLVAYATTITDLDPLRYNLLFERFLNPERVSMPDFDIDFCQDRREEVIDYVQKKYGAEQVAQIITFGTLQARAVLRDVGRVLQMPYGQVDRICKLVPANPADPWSIERTMKEVPQFKQMADEDETVGQLVEIAQALEGLFRHASTHAAGIVIGDRPLQKLLPLYRDPRSEMPVTQYNLKWVEPAGLVKFDFLGLKTLTTIRYAVEMVANRGINLDIDAIPIEDAATYKLYARGDTYGIFQFESAGMRRALMELKPDRIEDLIAMNALYRPGPMDNIPSFINRKHGTEEVSYPHPALSTVLDETYGIIVYQEQVMQIAQLLSGYSLGEADMLRRAMGKKIKAEMDAQRVRFREGSGPQGVSETLADEIFDLLAKFANYGFNKSHAAAYAWVSYQTAYLKEHFPHEFYAASMTLDMAQTDKLSDFRREAGKKGIEVVPPCVNRSEVVFSVKEDRIHYGLSAVKGVGRAMAEHIVEVRGNEPFKDLGDFARRVDPRVLNKRTLETLVNAGAFDGLVPRREVAFAAVESVIGTAQALTSERNEGQWNMFASAEPEPFRLPSGVPAWSSTERADRELAAIGFHLSAHPLDAYADLFEKLRVQRWSDFERAVKDGAGAGRLAGTISGRNDRRTRKGTPMMILSLSDQSGTFECIAFSEQINEFGAILQPGNSVILEVGADERAEGISLRLVSAKPIEGMAERVDRQMTIFMADAKALEPTSAQLKRGGNGTVSFVVIRDGGAREYELELPGKYQLTAEVAGGIKALDGVMDVRFA
ncbi:DNA polymerase III subunit alpha [Devosia sp. 63-57]|uniref:DNA polymerase III subunit alpha n=1 Tax=Devosia sp. 63-57 TaxID=1895751 RepID=UPI00086D6614|nr:DNA polymerase III subunit alpha [Devosia sp. 63-57]ODT50221.1 MAG: DNA polymerase III subunit alpha [Pelagibacterium sp. SCN 63-126]ODU84651.1 MAG: DNA polymerase III subunit alpha [Pelagibacterium sp. SCN 63-17]OJX44965.1 MAG: DNA polymerase III subunit alpha [Devosia sp. 63-57]